MFVDDKKLKYPMLGAFDKAMTGLLRKLDGEIEYRYIHQEDHVVSYVRDGLLFAYNFSPTELYTDYGVPTPDGAYEVILTSDDGKFGGHERIDPSAPYVSDVSREEPSPFRGDRGQRS